jgi:hypothetical protein
MGVMGQLLPADFRDPLLRDWGVIGGKKFKIRLIFLEKRKSISHHFHISKHRHNTPPLCVKQENHIIIRGGCGLWGIFGEPKFGNSLWGDYDT